MKTRTQIQLDPEDYRALKAWAQRRGISLSAAVRWLVRENLGGEEAPRDERVREFLAAAGSIQGGAGEGDISRRHDQVLYGRRRSR
jgi:hypothetical protein